MRINLLPDLVLQRRREAQIKRWTTLGLMGWLAFLVAVIVLAFSYKFYQGFRLKSAQDKYEQVSAEVNSAENVAFRTEALEVQSSLKALNALFGQQRRISEVLLKVGELTPQGVRLTEVNVAEDGRTALSGIASSYAEAGKMVVAMRNTQPELNNKEPEPYFDVVTLGGANEADGGVAFTITANYVDTRLAATVVQP